MSCEDSRLLHSALLDGELTPDERVQAEAHLATCVECTAELTALARTLGMLHALPHARAPLGFVDRVLVAARPMPWHQRWGRRLFRPLGVKLPLEAAAVMLVALGAMYVFQNTPELRQAARQEQPVTAPVPVVPPGPDAPSVTGPPAPSTGAPAESPQPPAEADRIAKNEKKEREGARSAAPVPATPPPAASGANADTRKMARGAKPERRTDAPGAAPGAAGLMKDAAPGQPAVAAQPPAAAQARASAPAAAPAPSVAPPADAPPSAPVPPVAGPSAPAQEARDKGAARSSPEGPQALEGVRPESKSGGLSARGRQVPSNLFVAPDASGRLTVGDRAAADRALADLGARLGGVQAFRRDEPAGALIEWIVPRETYPEFVRGLAAIGRWTSEREPATLPTRVRLQIRVGS